MLSHLTHRQATTSTKTEHRRDLAREPSLSLPCESARSRCYQQHMEHSRQRRRKGSVLSLTLPRGKEHPAEHHVIRRPVTTALASSPPADAAL
jgi:hypothetical protein